MLANLFESLSKIIVELIYPIIPKLYKLFEYFATFQFLSDDFIHDIWNNIYVFVAVIVLFAIAIKLISTMVNPDTLSDNKKGVKAYYFRTVISVVLIFIIPILFGYSYDIQRDIINKNFLMSHIFGYKISEGTNVGQALAWEAFSSFCTPIEESSVETNDDGKVTSLNNQMDDQQKVYYSLLEQSMEYMHMFLDTMKTSPAKVTSNQAKINYGFNYHSFLCPLAGILIAYEMLLLCMDTLFRSAKLALLELILPIVLGAYVFNPDILKKWAKEFFSTYITLFLKVLAIGFMIISLVGIKEKINAEDSFFKNDWLLLGLFRILFIIALLQLVKKIPDLINTIFGIKIQDQGGIKGRLGQMAGIGGIAQKAWSSLGNTAKNIAKLGLAAPIAGAYLGADAIYHKKTGERLKNTAAFRRGKGLIYGARAGLKNGSLIDAYQGYEQSSALSALTKADATGVSEKFNSLLAPYGIGKNGVYNGSKGTRPDGSPDFKNLSELTNDMNGVISTAEKNIRGPRHDEMISNLKGYRQAKERYSAVSGISKKRETISASLDEYAKRARDMANAGRISSKVADDISSMASVFKNDGKITSENFKLLAANGIASVSELATTAKTIQKYDKGVMEASNTFGYKESQLRGDVALGTNLGDAEKNYKSFEETAQKLMDDEKISQADKVRFKEAQSAISEISSKYSPTVQNATEYTMGDNKGERVAMSEDGEWFRDDKKFKEELEKVYKNAPSANDVERTIENQSQSSGTIITNEDIRGPKNNNHRAADATVTQQDIDAIHAAQDELKRQKEQINSQYGMSEEEKQKQLREIAREEQRLTAREYEIHGGTIDE